MKLVYSTLKTIADPVRPIDDTQEEAVIDETEDVATVIDEQVDKIEEEINADDSETEKKNMELDAKESTESEDKESSKMTEED